LFGLLLTLQIEATCSFETSVDFQRITRSCTSWCNNICVTINRVLN
jgi:hypothetical protein